MPVEAPPGSAPAADAPVTQLPGIGDARSKQLGRLNVRTVEDLLYLLPRRYDDFRVAPPLRELRPGMQVSVRAKVAECGVQRRRGGLIIESARLTDGTGEVTLVWFRRGRLGRPRFTAGTWVEAQGTVDSVPAASGGWVLKNPQCKALDGPPADTGAAGPYLPVYPLTAGLRQPVVRKAVRAALTSFATPDPIPEEIRLKYGLSPLHQALRAVHAPGGPEDARSGRRRLAFEDLLLWQLAAGLRRAAATRARPCPPDGAAVRTFFEGLPFVPTPSQMAAIEAIRSDLERPVPMRRLVVGDVGSGKTLVAAYAMAKAVQDGGQAALMAPTQLLAEQHFRSLRDMLGPAGVEVELWSPGKPALGLEADVVVGAHGLAGDAVQFRSLRLAVVDEEHRFGVRTREALTAKGEGHLLALSATPIPRTLMQASFGGLDATTLEGKPAGRGPVDTRWIRPEERGRLYEFVRKEVESGGQAYVVFPRVRGDDEAVSVEAGHAALQRGALRGLPVGMVHGGMPQAERERVMRRFAQGAVSVLVATTLVEVGLDVAGATVMVVEEADRFGLAQLHQLRGRVGRRGQKGYCFLICDGADERARRRMQIMRTVDDGFALAEMDLEMRGPGEVLGQRQWGRTEWRVASLDEDGALLPVAAEAARSILRRDPFLKRPEHAGLRRALEARYGLLTEAAG